jgi:hypothetical protein
MAETVVDPNDAEILREKISLIESVKEELATEIETEDKSFSLFGWVNRIFSRKNLLK